MVGRTEREQAALLLVADGDEGRLEAAFERARLDVRDLLMDAGLADERWPERLDHILGRTSRPPAGPTRQWRRLRAVLLVLVVSPAALFFVVGIPLLLADDYRDATARVASTTGVVLEQRGGWSKGGRRHVCTYAYVVAGTNRTGASECSGDDRAGDEVTVRYDPQEPASSDLGGSDRTGLVMGLAAVAGCLAVFAVHMARGHRRRGRRLRS